MTDEYSSNDIIDRFAPLTSSELTPNHQIDDADIDFDGKTSIVVDSAPARLPRRRDGRPSRIWTYVNETSKIVFLALRFDKLQGKSFAVCSPWRTAGGEIVWEWKLPPGKRPLYRLDQMVRDPDRPIIICEGEKAADAATDIFPECLITTWSGGSNAVGKTTFDVLRGRNVTIWPDNDQAGIGAGKRLTEILQDLDCHVSVIDPVAASSIAPGNLADTRPPIASWDAADATKEWSDLALLRQALEIVTRKVDPPPKYRSHGDFIMTFVGLTTVDRRKNGEAGGVIKIANAFEVIGRTRDPSGNGWGRLLRWRDTDKREHTKFVSDADLHGDLSRLSSNLAAAGLKIERSRGGVLADYINGVEELPSITIVDRTGWHHVGGEKVFVLPSGAIGHPNGERIEYVGTSSAPFAGAGKLIDWSNGVGALIQGHSRHMFAVMASLVGPLLDITGYPGFGVNLFGISSTGKTTAVQAGASVWGSGSINGFVRSWRATGNALEAFAAMHTDTALVLDELGQVEGRHAGMAAYQFSAGTGKGRSQTDGSLRNPQTFRTVVLSTGEVRLTDKVVEDGGRPMAGQMVRFLDIPADAGQGYGSFDHGGSTGNARDIADSIKEAARNCYGTAGPTFVQALVSHGVERAGQEAAIAIGNFHCRMVPRGADGQVQRVADCFALVAFAGEFAIEHGILPWHAGAATKAADTCFEAWLSERGHMEPNEVQQGEDRVRTFIQTHGSARFEPLPGVRPLLTAAVRERAGYCRGEGNQKQWLIFPHVWTNEILAGLNASAVTAALIRKRMMVTTGGGYQVNAKVAGKQVRFYAVKADILSGTETNAKKDDPPE